ncbi:hypothetical protein HIM_07786 [Hirsutella minnesotensis 3608]|uniref:Conserved oligomeric Golgi complex subunit 1 n=1 Tax=Hirsutella minnesotensis 3608 TaxID=1043627 RepID=A0A0F7ZYP7_9HYPO|nr:hypothetical protein HIM_07786 [Hirsutella minnesotensis 3608]
MASAPDPSAFETSAQIFATKHTLPQIRAIHNALNVQIEEKASRLRSQVGGSYRELLGTAETIVQMRGDNDRVQELLGKMGGRCGRGVVSSKAKGLARFEARDKDPVIGQAVRLRLLDACGLTVGRILKGQAGVGRGAKRGERLLLATKVWVLSRLLIKSFAQDAPADGTQDRLEAAKRTTSSLRRRLLGCVRKILEKADGDSETGDVLKALCAYSLINSAGARDVLRYFLTARGEAMAMAFVAEDGVPSPDTEDVIRGLGLYTGTLLEVQSLIPAKLAPALAGLKDQRLLADPALKGLENLNLDVSEGWCSEEIQYFTPFVRHDNLEPKQAREMLADWADKGGQVILDGLNKTVERMVELKSITDLRTRVLQLWIRDGGRAKGFDPLEMQDDLRDAINSRMLAVLETKVAKLRLVGSEVRATIRGWQQGITDKVAGLWDEDGYDAALANGASPFVQEVVTRLYGRSDAVSKAAHGYSSWVHVIDDVRDVIEQLRKQRWDNDYDEIEDEETIEARQQVLSKEDPSNLQNKLDTALDRAFGELEEQLAEVWAENSNASVNGPVAMYFVRVIREMRNQLPERPAIKDFGLALVPDLHKHAVAHVSAPALEEFATVCLADREVAGKILWEGQPPLPNQPSPGIFQFLQTLSLSMADAGVDLWSAAAVVTLKELVCAKLGEAWLKELSELESANATEAGQDGTDGHKTIADDETPDDDETANKNEEDRGDEEVDDTTNVKKDRGMSDGQIRDISIQWLFDASYLLCCVGNLSGSASKDMTAVANEIYKRTALGNDSLRQRIVKAAQDYWQRTNLLFGLLA